MFKRSSWLLALVAGVAGCDPGGQSPAPSGGKVGVVVSVMPHAWLAEQVGGEHVEVTALCQPAEDPHTYQPTDAQVSQIMRSAVYFRTGVSFENGNWYKALEKSQKLKIVDLRGGIALRDMEAHSHHDDDGHDHDGHDHDGHDHDKHAHDHDKEKGEKDGDHKDKAKSDEKEHDHDHAEDGKKSKDADGDHDHKGHDHDHEGHDHDHGHAHDHHHHEHGSKDPHIWLSPMLLVKQAEAIEHTLSSIDPEHKDAYAKNLSSLTKRLKEADERLREQLKPARGKAFYVFHPAWGYFADEYGLRQRAIEMEGKEPSDKELTEIQKEAKEDGIKVIFFQPQIPGRTAKAVAQAIGARTEQLDPLAKDVLANLTEVASRVIKAYE